MFSCFVFSYFVLFLFLIFEVKIVVYVLVERVKCLMFLFKVKYWYLGVFLVGRFICFLWREELLFDKFFSNVFEFVIFEFFLVIFMRFEGNMSWYSFFDVEVMFFILLYLNLWFVVVDIYWWCVFFWKVWVFRFLVVFMVVSVLLVLFYFIYVVKIYDNMWV